MNEAVYSVLVYAARYWFIGLAVLIVARAFLISLRESRLFSRLRKEIGEEGARIRLVVLHDPSGRYEEGTEYSIPIEGTVGRSSSNDVCIRQKSISRRHARLQERGDALQIRPEHGAYVALDGVQIGREASAGENAVLTLGDMEFRLRIVREEAEV